MNSESPPIPLSSTRTLLHSCMHCTRAQCIFFLKETRCIFSLSSENQTPLHKAKPFLTCPHQGLIYRPVRSNRRGPVPVYRTGLTGNRSKPVEVKFEFKSRSANGSYRLTGRFDRFTGRFDRFEFKSKFKIACVTSLERYTGRFDQFTGRFDQFTK